MNKLFQLGAIFCGVLLTPVLSADTTPMQGGAMSAQPSMSAGDTYQAGSYGRTFRGGDAAAYGRGFRGSDSSYYSTTNVGGGTYYADAGAGGASMVGGSYVAGGSAAGCPEDHPCCDQATGDCWCMYVHYKPCYYTTKRCITEQIPCKKSCCRYVDQYYEVDRCRWVPEHYCETCCRKVPEYYEVDDCKCCQRWVCDQHCQYVPQYYWKHVCGQQNCATPCPTGCATGCAQ